MKPVRRVSILSLVAPGLITLSMLLDFLSHPAGGQAVFALSIGAAAFILLIVSIILYVRYRRSLRE